MGDPFLQAHHFGPLIFSIGGKLLPISLRDQMLRGELFVERLLQAGRDHTDRKLLIVGAGGGGVAAAMTAASYDVETVLIDKQGMIFALQSKCPTRWVSPTLYDFPVNHWGLGQFPPTPGRLNYELAWQEGDAQSLALNWYQQFREADDFCTHLNFLPYTRLDGVPKIDRSNAFTVANLVTHEPNQPTQHFKIECFAVLLATGAGPEKTYLRNPGGPPQPARGYPFWAKDPFSEQNYGLSEDVEPNILISGSGDGALQDFLRVTTTCHTTKDLCETIQITPERLCTLHSAQARALREWQWGLKPDHDHGVLNALHAVHAKLVMEMLSNNEGNVREKVRSVLRQPIPSVRLVYECTHFSHCYCLNRFLALLVGAVLDELKLGESVFIPKARLEHIEGIAPDHTCRGDFKACHGGRHRATLIARDDCRQSVQQHSQRPAGTLEPNVLIIRHGIDTADIPLDATPRVSRHLLPYFFSA